MSDLRKQQVRFFAERAAQLLVFISFFTPVVVVTSSFIFPFVVPRVLFFRIVISLALFAYSVLLLVNFQQYRPKKDIVSMAVYIFFGSWLVSTLLSRDMHRSLWDNHERMLGLYTMVHYGLLYVIAQNVFRKWQEWRLLWFVFMVVSLPVFITGIHQMADKTYLLNRDATRIASTLGNPIYVSAHAIFVFMLCVYFFVKEKVTGIRLFTGVVGVLAFLNFVASDTRGTSLGFVVAVVLLPLLIVFLQKNKKRMRYALVGIVVAFIIAGGALYAHRSAPVVRDLPIIGRLLNIQIQGSTAETRLIAWNISLQSFKERPLFGWGPVNYYFAFNEYYNPRSFLHGLQETWFDNAHSMVFNTLTERGIVGLASYLLLYVAPLIVVFRARNKEGGLSLVLFSCAFLTTHFIHNLIVFENVTSYLYFFLFLAFISWIGRDNHYQEEPVAAHLPSQAGVICAAVVVLVMVYSWNVQVARGNMATFNTLQRFGVSLDEGMKSFEAALAIRTPHRDDVRNDVTGSILRALRAPQSPAEADALKRLLLYLRTEQEKSLETHPLDIRLYMSIATVNRGLAFVTKDKDFLFEALKSLEKARELSPKRQQLLFDAADIYRVLGQGDQALALLQQAIDLEPGLKEAHAQFANIAFQFNYKQQAAASMLRALEMRFLPQRPEDSAAIGTILAGGDSETDTLIADVHRFRDRYDATSTRGLFDEIVTHIERERLGSAAAQ